MARVDLAEDTLLGRQVALKRIAGPADHRGLSRLRREALAGASLSHPNLVAIYDVVTSEEGQLVIVMEYIAGGTLRDALNRQGRLPADEALRVLDGVAAGLDAIHERGIVHRDVKPSNILLGDGGAVKVADLGIAAIPERTRITTSGSVLGSLSYMAPEQLENARSTPAIDVYALAAVAYEVLSGQKARRETNPVTLAHAIATQAPPNLRTAWPDAPPGAADLLVRAMARDPAERPGSAGELVRRLRTALAPEPTTVVTPARAGAGAARSPRAAAAAAPVAAAAAAGTRGLRQRPAASPRGGGGEGRSGRRPPSPRHLPPPQPPRRRSRTAAVVAGLLALVAAGVIAAVVLSSGGSGSGGAGSASGAQASRAAQASRRHRRTHSATTRAHTSASTTATTASTPAATSTTPAASGTAPAASSSTTPAPPASSPGGAAAGSPVSAVEGFYGAAAAHHYAAAWALADPTMRAEVGGYPSFQAGQAGDRSITFNSARVVSQSGHAATVAVRTTSVRTDGTQHCAGTVQLVPAGGQWRLHLIHINCS